MKSHNAALIDFESLFIDFFFCFFFLESARFFGPKIVVPARALNLCAGRRDD